MASYKIFKATDLFKLSNINLDKFTENYQISFYLYYMAKWPDMNYVAYSPHGTPMGYFMGKMEGLDKEWHGHVTAVTICPQYRRLGIAEKLMNILESISEKYQGYFVDLYVRPSNKVAVDMYKKFGYVIYRNVIGYYSGDPNHSEENAYDMRKALSRDTEKQCLVTENFNVFADEVT